MVRGCIQGESDVQTCLPHLLDLYRHGKLPIKRAGAALATGGN
jgi:Zn-dependent alcohol dehydrogenase